MSLSRRSPTITLSSAVHPASSRAFSKISLSGLAYPSSADAAITSKYWCKPQDSKRSAVPGFWFAIIPSLYPLATRADNVLCVSRVWNFILRVPWGFCQSKVFDSGRVSVLSLPGKSNTDIVKFFEGDICAGNHFTNTAIVCFSFIDERRADIKENPLNHYLSSLGCI